MDRQTRRQRMDRKIIEFLVQKKGINETSKTLHVGKTRIRSVRERGKEYGYLPESGSGAGPQALPPYPHALFPDPRDGRMLIVSEPHRRLDEHRAWIEERLSAGWHSVTVYEELPIQGICRSSFYRYLEKHKIHKLGEPYRRVVPEILHGPGECLQLDWGKLRYVIDERDKKKRTLWMFIGVLGFSRYRMVRLVWDNKVETTLAAIESMFQELGGVPMKLTSDNPKCFALVADRFEPLLNPAMERFCSHYGTLMECLPPRDPEKKGKVERQMPYVRRLYEAHGDEWHGIEESQEYLNRKMTIANQKKHGTTGLRPVEVFEKQEKEKLKALPALSYEIEEYHEGDVRRDGCVRFRGKYYSLDEQHIGKSVVVLGTKTVISIFCRGKLLETHDRIHDPHQSKSIKPHHMKPWERSMQDDSVYLKRAEHLGPSVKELISIILKQGEGFIDTRKIWGILSLDKKYTPEKLNDACKGAIEIESYSYRAVKTFLNLSPKGTQDQKTDESWTNKENKFVRPLSEYEEQLNLLLH